MPVSYSKPARTFVSSYIVTFCVKSLREFLFLYLYVKYYFKMWPEACISDSLYNKLQLLHGLLRCKSTDLSRNIFNDFSRLPSTAFSINSSKDILCSFFQDFPIMPPKTCLRFGKNVFKFYFSNNAPKFHKETS